MARKVTNCIPLDGKAKIMLFIAIILTPVIEKGYGAVPGWCLLFESGIPYFGVILFEYYLLIVIIFGGMKMLVRRNRTIGFDSGKTGMELHSTRNCGAASHDLL